MGVDEFLRDFLPLRKLCNERRFKSEKLAESLSSSRPVVPSRPTLAPAPLREPPKPPIPAASINSGSGSLYPDLSQPGNTPNNRPTFGFNM
ncbi:unnamed protein product [Echinostoma caproni]|uniref:VPS37 C-terminal domain-containing protein n=1 Tax=Echinostoma caproni TaxID=27848 RepID=A0A183AW15_9TREM|nr:unnamed protein product [Echinostoma caproni]